MKSNKPRNVIADNFLFLIILSIRSFGELCGLADADVAIMICIAFILSVQFTFETILLLIIIIQKNPSLLNNIYKPWISYSSRT